MNEKTWPVTIGEAEKDMIAKIQTLTRERIGFEVTQRAIVTRAIKLLYDTVTKTD